MEPNDSPPAPEGARARWRRWRRYRQALAELSAETSKTEWPLSPGTRERLRKRAHRAADTGRL